MNKEEFIEKIKEIKINTPNKEFFLEYNECVYDILDENENLKKENQELSSRIDKAVDITNRIIEEYKINYGDNYSKIVYALEAQLKILKGGKDE